MLKNFRDYMRWRLKDKTQVQLKTILQTVALWRRGYAASTIVSRSGAVSVRLRTIARCLRAKS
jgi:hypothetical protein